MSFENHARTLDMLFDANHNQVGPKALKKIMKKYLDRDYDLVGGADYVIDRWKDGRIRYGNDKPQAVKVLEMIWKT